LADVPLGAFLSGGVDSSTIVALMQAHSSRPVQTFTIGFDEPGFDESPHAAAVAAHLGTQHHMMRVTAAQAREVIPLLPQMYDEPFADSSQIPTHLVSRAARQQVTVALSGDAGDELFGGYNRYFWGPRVWNKTAWLPYPLRRALGGAVRALPPRGWDALSSLAGVNRLGDKAHKLGARLASVRTLDDLYWSLVTEWPAGQGLVRGLSAGEEAAGALAAGGVPRSGFGDGLVGRQMSEPPEGLQDATARMMYRDALTYLPDDILCKVDRAAMACSLETRVPFLDHRVVELAWRLPMDMKVRGNVGKWALRQVLYKHVPRELIERPKAGFGIPVGVWLRGPLREWAEDLLNEQRLRDEGFLNPQPIRQAWAQHLSGRHDWTARLWTVLMFEAWRERWV
jgi:asparagine synthase (glutamine-hydrolysing)